MTYRRSADYRAASPSGSTLSECGSLLRPKRAHGINPGRAARRNPDGRQGHQTRRHGRRDARRWIGRAQGLHTSILAEYMTAPLRPAVADEFRWFCQVRRASDDGRRAVLPADAARYAAARRAFGAPRFYAAYRAWRAHGDAVFHDLLSPRLHEAWTRGDGREEIHVLPYQYQHLAVAVATA